MRNRGPKPFKLFSCWFNHEGFRLVFVGVFFNFLLSEDMLLLEALFLIREVKEIAWLSDGEKSLGPWWFSVWIS